MTFQNRRYTLRFVARIAAVALLGFAAASPVRAEAIPPVRIAFVGDSMADGLWGAMFRRLGKDKCLAEKVKLIRKARNGTGLTRLDQHNWIDEVAALAAGVDPDLFVGSFGINDRQPIVERDRHHVEYGTPAFDERYGAIVQDVLRAAIAKGGSMLIIGLPVMMEADANTDALDKNKIFEAAIKAVDSPRATYVQPWTSQAAPDVYKPFLPNAKNNMVQVRAPDGIHFTTAGYDMVMDAIYPSIMASLKARGRDFAAECPSQVGVR